MMTTCLSPHQLNKPTRDVLLNEVLAEVRQCTGENWQVVEFTNITRKWFRDREYVWYGLHVEVGGVLPYQVISCVNTAKERKAYLYGILTGLGTEEVTHEV